MNRDLEQAREAYLQGNIEMSKQAHDKGENLYTVVENQKQKLQEKEDTKHKEKHQSGGDYLKSAVFGGMDGIITTYSVVMGVLGANLPPGVVLAMGISNVIGDGISMALGDYLSTKADNGYQKMERMREEWEVQNNPEGEKAEMIKLYTERGMPIEDATIITESISKNKEAWVSIMMTEELGMGAPDEHPFKNALVTFISFLLFGLVSLIPFIVAAIANLHEGLFIASTVMVGVFLFILGVSKSMFSYAKWYKSGLETLFVGACSAVSAYLVGLAFEPLTGGAQA